MKAGKRIRAGILSALLLFFAWSIGAASPVAAAAGDIAETQYQALEVAKQAVKLMEGQKFTEAYNMLKAEYAQYENDNNINFLLGQCSSSLGRPAEAIGYYKKILILTPELPRVRLELGRAYAANGQFNDAKVEFQSVLATKPPQEVAEHVNAFLKQMEEQKSVHIRASVGYLYDSNVNAGPDNVIISKAGWVTDNRKRSDHAVTTGLFLDQFNQNGPDKAWQTGFSYFRTSYQKYHDQSWDEFNLMTGPLFKKGKNTFNVPLVARFSFIGGQKNSFTYGLAPQWQYEQAKDKILTVSAGLLSRHYYDVNERSGKIYSFNVAERWLFGNAGYLELGMGHTRETAETDYYANFSNSFRLTYYRQLPRGYGLVIQPSFTLYHYRGVDPYSELPQEQPAGRRDTQRNILINIIKTAGDWNYSLGCTFTSNYSNMDIYRYDRTQFHIQAFRNF